MKEEVKIQTFVWILVISMAINIALLDLLGSKNSEIEQLEHDKSNLEAMLSMEQSRSSRYFQQWADVDFMYQYCKSVK